MQPSAILDFFVVIVLHPGTLYYVHNSVLNFHLDWFSTFWYTGTWSFMLEITYSGPFQGQIFKVFRGK